MASATVTPPHGQGGELSILKAKMLKESCFVTGQRDRFHSLAIESQDIKNWIRMDICFNYIFHTWSVPGRLKTLCRADSCSRASGASKDGYPDSCKDQKEARTESSLNHKLNISCPLNTLSLGVTWFALVRQPTEALNSYIQLLLVSISSKQGPERLVSEASPQGPALTRALTGTLVLPGVKEMPARSQFSQLPVLPAFVQTGEF